MATGATIHTANETTARHQRTRMYFTMCPFSQVGMATGATIHTANGMPMRVARRNTAALRQPAPQAAGVA